MLVINDDCINCDACVPECPNNAIYEPDEEWVVENCNVIAYIIHEETGEVLQVAELGIEIE